MHRHPRGAVLLPGVASTRDNGGFAVTAEPP